MLFDLDGTLTDPFEGITRSVEYALNAFGIEVEDRRVLAPFIGPPLVESLTERYGFTMEDAVAAVAKYREYFAVKGLYENELFEGIPELLNDCRKAGYKISMATSKPTHYARIIAEHFDTIHFVEVKTRLRTGWQSPYDSIDDNKRRSLRRAAAAYTAMHHPRMTTQFDLLAVETTPEGEYTVEYIENIM